MQADYIAINNLLQLYRQVLENPQGWDPQRLKLMANDHEYNYAQIRDAYTATSGKEPTL